MFEVKEVNAETGEEIVRPATAEEIAQAQLDIQNAEEAEAKRQELINKFKALGFEVSDLEALGLI